jgi:hypothetical protein
MAYVKKDMLCAKVYHNLRSNYLIYYFHSWYRKGATPFWLCTQAMHATSNSHKAFLVRWFATAIDDVHYLTVEAETYQELVGNMATIMQRPPKTGSPVYARSIHTEAPIRFTLPRGLPLLSSWILPRSIHLLKLGIKITRYHFLWLTRRPFDSKWPGHPRPPSIIPAYLTTLCHMYPCVSTTTTRS